MVCIDRSVAVGLIPAKTCLASSFSSAEACSDFDRKIVPASLTGSRKEQDILLNNAGSCRYLQWSQGQNGNMLVFDLL